MDAAVLVLLLQRGELPKPTSDAIVRSAQAVLGASATVQTVEVDAVDDAGALREGTEHHATAVAEIRSDGNRVHVRVLVTSETRWADRDVGFSDRDRPEERGRTIGFTVASMMPNSVDVHPLDPPKGPDNVVAPPKRDVPPLLPPVERRWVGAIDALGAAAVPLGGSGGGFGATFAGTIYPKAPTSTAFGLRLFVSPRFGEIGAAQATMLSVAMGGGVSLQLGGARPGTFGFGMRVDLLAAFLRVSHFSQDDPEAAHLSRWLPGFDAALEGSVRVAPALAIVVGAGVEGYFGSTDVYVRGQQVTTISPLRLFGEVGIRARF